MNESRDINRCYRTLSRNFAVMGALLTIASYVVDPFSQQLAKTYPCNIPSHKEASIVVARRVSSYYFSDRPLMWLAATTGLTGLSLSYTMADTSKSQLFQCPSGNCTFPMKSNITHTSAGICSTCTDVSSKLMEINIGNQSLMYQFPWQPSLNLTWPHDGSYFHARTIPRSYLSTSDANHAAFSTTSIITFSTAVCRNRSETSRTYKEKRCRKADSFSAYSEWERDAHIGIVAVNCSLSPCLRRYRGEVSLGTLREKLVSQEPMDLVTLNETLDDSSNQWSMKLEPCEVDGRWYDSSNITQAPRDSSWISWEDDERNWHQAPKQCLMGLGSNLINYIDQFQQLVIKGDMGYTLIEPETVAWLPALARQCNATFELISDSFDGMAAGYSDFMRGDWEELPNERFNVVGTAYKSAVCIRADWPWLVYPAVLLASTTILLITASVYSMREGGQRPVWKSTILPFLLHNLTMDRNSAQDPTDENGVEVPLLQVKELETLADKTVAKFSADAGFIVENGGARGGGASIGQ